MELAGAPAARSTSATRDEPDLVLWAFKSMIVSARSWAVFPTIAMLRRDLRKIAVEQLKRYPTTLARFLGLVR